MTSTIAAGTGHASVVLLSLGRLPKALDIARCLHAAGCRVIVAEPFGWHLCRISNAVARSYRVTPPGDDPALYRKEMLDIIERESVTLVIPVSEEAMHLVLIEAQLPPGVRLLSAPAAAVRGQHDKLAFIDTAAAFDLAVPATATLGTPAAVELAQTRDTVVKPVFSCSGTELRFVEAGDPLPPPAPNRRVLVQRRLPGAHRCSLSFAHNGTLLGHVVYRGTLMSGTVAAAFERVEAPAVDSWVKRFVSRTDWSGFVAFDFIDDEHGAPCAIECNPRLTSGVHFFEPETLAQALLTPDAMDTVIRFRRTRRLHQFYTSLTEMQSALFKPRRWRECFDIIRTHTDVTWQWRDPLPFLLMTPLTLPIISRSILGRMSLGDAATRDIARFSDSH